MINLCDLALSSLVFDALTGYTSSLSRLVAATGGNVDLCNPEHRKAVLKWLNDWGCRHLAKEEHETASAALFTWYQDGNASPLPQDRVLWNLTDKEMAAAALAYGSLKDRTAAERKLGGFVQSVQMGPTAASKVLFALRPKALPPWDEAMRIGFGCDGSPESYLRFLQDIRLLVQRIAGLCDEIGFGIAGLPSVLCCPNATVVEVVNKHLWLKHARRWTPPAPDIVGTWAEWGLRVSSFPSHAGIGGSAASNEA